MGKKRKMKPRKGKKPVSKSKHKKSQVWKKYKIEGGKAVKKGRVCPRCGSGVFMAEHKNRNVCGKCGYSEILKR